MLFKHQRYKYFSMAIMRPFLLSALIGSSLVSGCQVVSVKQQKIGTTLSNERDSILTRNKLSEASLNILSMAGNEAEKCVEAPSGCIDKLQQIQEIADEQRLATGSELYLSHAISLKNSSDCSINGTIQKLRKPEEQQAITQQHQNCMLKQMDALSLSIRYSYAYLFASQRPAQERLFNNRQVQVRDFYNQAIANLINAYNDTTIEYKSSIQPEIDIGNTRYHIDISLYPELQQQKVERLLSTYNLAFSGLRSISRRDGFGAEFVIQLEQPEKKTFSEYQSNPLQQYQSIQAHPNIHEATFLPATLIVEPEQKSNVEQILNSKDLRIKVIDPNRQSTTKVSNQEFPLAANFSAPYGLWLANNNLGASAYWTLIDRDQTLVMPHLFMLEPYNPNKKVIIMVHGLASSPEAWIAMTNDIMGDSVLREQFQVWQIFYSTNMPILESRYQIYALLKQTFNDLEQQYPKQPPRHAVLLGHSMGGVISRLLLSNDDFSSQILAHLQYKNTQQYKGIKNLNLAVQRFKMEALTPEIDRAIFISSPLQGTDFADRWFTLLARKIIKLPQGFLHATSDVLRGDLGEAADTLQKISKDFMQNGPSDLSKKSAFMKITGQASISDQVKYHSIIGNSSKQQVLDLITDGVVPYYSAHLEHAESEKIITGGHSIQYTPESVIELRRILRLHLKETGQAQP